VTRFRRRRKTVVVSFAEHEADILANLLRNLVELLYDGLPPRATESAIGCENAWRPARRMSSSGEAPAKAVPSAPVTR